MAFNITLQEKTTIPYLENSTEHYNEGDARLEHIASIIRVFSIVVYSVAFLLGTFGNGLVIYFTAFVMKRTVNVVWFLNLAIADFIFTFFLPLSIAYAGLNFYWPFGKFMCKLNSFIAFVNLYASVLQLTVISIDRCISVVFPVWCQNHRTPRLASFVALVVWILALIFSVPYFIFRDIYVEEDVVVCFNNFHEDPYIANVRHRATVIFRFIFSFLIPFTVIIFCYSVILFRIQRNHMTTSSKPLKVILAVIITFFVCWVPYQVFSFLELYVISSESDQFAYVVHAATPFTSSLAFINSCVNPVLYVFIGRDFKNKFQISFQAIFERAFMEESGQTDLKSKSKSTSDSQLV
ncbi:PREDICTED: chemokine-like receptor 1 [Nanorana parkeri]|uniref:chemokine-like receptor 1 n=1 Tax=Nanorana parkeri TaxID=125878 RepID=UPI000854189E|nr:PREDICTED: chemokine-like receptor 1 [Nanorana parkeri]